MIWAIARYDDPDTETLVARMALPRLAALAQGQPLDGRVPSWAHVIWPWRVA